MSDLADRQRRFIEVFQVGRDYAVGDALIADNMVNHTPTPGLPPDKAGTIAFHQGLHGGIPDLTVEIEDMLVDGDKVVTRKTFRGTHGGDFLGIPATGKPVSVGVIDIVRYENGQIVEHWNQVDMFGLMQQLGVIPS
jgi:steroid delta-isomerase-like uncharacterized protein